MPLTQEEILKIAKLAQIALNEEDVPRYADELSGILDFVNVLDEADTRGVTPMAHPVVSETFLREDIVSEKISRTSFRGNAPDEADNYYLVPRVIE